MSCFYKVLYIIFIIIIFLTFSCKRNIPVVNLEDLTKDNINAKKIWERITKETDYKNYPMWPEHKGMQVGMSPHGRYHKVFINQKFLDNVPNKDRLAPYGAICVKENYNSNKELVMITVMVKVKDLNKLIDNKNEEKTKDSHEEEGEDELNKSEWYWVKFDNKGNIGVEGQLMACVKCHSGSNNDFITIRKLDKPLDKK